MADWTDHELERFARAEEIEIAPLKEDGTVYKPVIIWAVRIGNDLYVRSYRGDKAAWFRHAQQRPEGQISAEGVTKKVAFIDASTDEDLNNQIDAAYQAKYRQYSTTYVPPMIAPLARKTTFKLVPFN